MVLTIFLMRDRELLEIKDEFRESLIYRNSLDLLVKNLDRYINKSLMLTYQGCLKNHMLS